MHSNTFLFVINQDLTPRTVARSRMATTSYSSSSVPPSSNPSCAKTSPPCSTKPSTPATGTAATSSCRTKTHTYYSSPSTNKAKQDHRYLGHWIDDHTVHWQSQSATAPDSKRGREIIEREKRGISLHLFVRDVKLAGGKAAPFVYHGAVRYRSHTGSAPMSVVFEVGG